MNLNSLIRVVSIPASLSILLVVHSGCGRSEEQDDVPVTESSEMASSTVDSENLPMNESQLQSTESTPPTVEPVDEEPGEVAPAESTGTERVALPRLSFEVPVEWEREVTASSMRAAQWVIQAPGDGDLIDTASLVVFDFGPTGAGDVESNLNRWALQISQPDGVPSMQRADRWMVEKEDHTVHYFEVGGTFVAETTPGSGVRVNRPDSKLIATIVETGRGPYYFKLTGPRIVVDAWKPEYMKMIESFTVPEQSTGEGG